MDKVILGLVLLGVLGFGILGLNQMQMSTNMTAFSPVISNTFFNYLPMIGIGGVLFFIVMILVNGGKK